MSIPWNLFSAILGAAGVIQGEQAAQQSERQWADALSANQRLRRDIESTHAQAWEDIVPVLRQQQAEFADRATGLTQGYQQAQQGALDMVSDYGADQRAAIESDYDDRLQQVVGQLNRSGLGGTVAQSVMEQGVGRERSEALARASEMNQLMRMNVYGSTEQARLGSQAAEAALAERGATTEASTLTGLYGGQIASLENISIPYPNVTGAQIMQAGLMNAAQTFGNIGRQREIQMQIDDLDSGWAPWLGLGASGAGAGMGLAGAATGNFPLAFAGAATSGFGGALGSAPF